MRGFRIPNEDLREMIISDRKEPKLRVNGPTPLPGIVVTVIKAVADKWEIEPDRISCRSREQHLVRAREIVAFILREEYSLSLKQIGRALNRHHTSILYLHEQAKNRYQADERVRRIIDGIAGKSYDMRNRDELGLPVEAA